MLTLPSSVKIFIYAQPADMRCGYHKLSMMAESFMQKDPLSGHLFVFFNKTGDKCKILFWDRTGFVTWYKVLEEGTFEKLPCKDNKPSIEVDIAKLTWILEGIDLFKARRRKRYERKTDPQALSIKNISFFQDFLLAFLAVFDTLLSSLWMMIFFLYVPSNGNGKSSNYSPKL